MFYTFVQNAHLFKACVSHATHKTCASEFYNFTLQSQRVYMIDYICDLDWQ